METYRRKTPFRRTLATTIPPPSPLPPPPPPPPPEEDIFILKPASLFIKFMAFQVDLISNCLLSLSSSFLNFLSITSSKSLLRAEEARNTTEEAVLAATRVPSRVACGGGLVLRKLGFGFLGAAYVCLVLVIVMAFAIIIGVGLVQLWVEEPVFVKEPLHFDYTDVHPSAVHSLGGGLQGKKKRAIPSGHTFYVSVVLLMPESDYNRRIGVFQLTAEVISTTGGIIAKSSQPCMLHFRSLPIRLLRTFVLGIPLLLGYSTETQRIIVGLLKHKEGKPQTEAIRITLIPRAGTTSPPELYTAEIVLNSHLPPRKELVYNWKFTFYIWATFSVYIMLIVILVCCFKPFVFPTLTPTGARGQNQRDHSVEVVNFPQPEVRGDGEIPNTRRKWQRSRRRRPLFPHRMALTETVGSSALGTTGNRADMSEVIDDSGGFTDSESVCLGG
ncbi:seipin-1 [Telopea speciosissima]|uniref:seipin-1 n=1 Tax=Telopea speciosissima TaxID=54955 RepID=UPI001CC6D6E3|nr:seipin-1 [Telopea speciosissima]